MNGLPKVEMKAKRVCPALIRRLVLIAGTCLWIASGTAAGAKGQDDATPASEVVETAPPKGADVIIDGRTVVTVFQPIGAYTAGDRAVAIAERIIAVANDLTIPANSVTGTTRPAWTEISAGGRVLLVVTDEDAKLSGKQRAELAGEDVQRIQEFLGNYRRDHSWRALAKGIGLTFLATLILVPLAWMFRKGALRLGRYLELWIDRAKMRHPRSAVHAAITYCGSLALSLEFVVRWLILLALVEIYLTIVLSFFPQTRAVSSAITGWILIALKTLAMSVVGYIPNLVVIAFVAIVASQIFRLIRMFFREISQGNLAITGFHPEWAEPTAKLCRMMVLVLVIIVIFPYLPGSKSPAFQGVSIFVGLLLSLGSSSAVANAIAGIILTYMRSFSVGDWVKIGDTIGEVQEKNMLVTRILTQKHETITIPNATVMNGSVMNFTREAKNPGVIFHTTVTIGYDAPWKTVHRLLTDAAMATQHVLHNPEPFVLQTALNDFYVSYELNAYTDVPRQMQFIYSDLHQNIQDRFNEAGVEICSPHFSSLRDGNAIAIPPQYIERDYRAPGFRIDAEAKREGEAIDIAR